MVKDKKEYLLPEQYFFKVLIAKKKLHGEYLGLSLIRMVRDRKESRLFPYSP